MDTLLKINYQENNLDTIKNLIKSRLDNYYFDFMELKLKTSSLDFINYKNMKEELSFFLDDKNYNKLIENLNEKEILIFNEILNHHKKTLTN